MTAARSARLYTPALLGLATELAAYPLEADLPHRAEARSRSCGSVIALGLMLDASGRPLRIGMQVSACAIGQASAALLARSIGGSAPQAIISVRDGLACWLAGKGALPDWPGLEALIPVLAHPGRHGAAMLPWTAAGLALSSAGAGG